MINRPRRLRTNGSLRKMVRETKISIDSLIYPFFVKDGENIKTPISSMDGQFHYSIDRVHEFIEESLAKGVSRFMIFGVPDHKDACGSSAHAEDGIVQRGIFEIKKRYPEAYIIADTCMCEYTSHGHCGILDGEYVDNDKTIDMIAKIAFSQVRAGADMIAPSDMMDGRVSAIREILDKNGYHNTPIMSYSAKYCSAFYGPFRDAAGSAPSFGDRKQYQMDHHNSDEAIREIRLDIEEGADIVMVKPALSYLDVIRRAKDNFDLPIAAYSVSGEYAMIKAAAKAGLIDEYKVMCETAASIYRAGSDILITYFAKELAEAIRKGDVG
ncbi:MAG: porphobilinogen synthase [Peptostreptococcaceae bacterium]|nr:porphobilinogen synthase [Peptostreptococcaceae bacterium]